MLGYIARRLIAAAVVVVVIFTAVFALFFYGPSDPGQAICNAQGRCTPERAQNINETLGFNDPIGEQYVLFAKGIFTGREVSFGGASIDCPAPCFGVSYTTRQPVTQILVDRFPATLSIAIGGAMIFFPLGVLLGTLAARRRGSITDRSLVGSSLLVSSIPYYIVCLLTYLYLVVQWGIFPDSEYYPILENPLKWFGGLLLPWLVLGVATSTAYARFSRGSMIESLSEDYVRTAKAKGLTDRRVTVRHALRAAIVPVVTIFGLDFAALLAGTVFTEAIFGIQGIGREALRAIFAQDFPVVLATVVVAAVFIVLANVIVDVLYSVIDPRVRLT